MTDPYSTLGVGRDCSEADIKAAYRKRAGESHPDGGDSVDEWHGVRESYELLSDPSRRRNYDATGETEPEPQNIADGIVIDAFIRLATQEIRRNLGEALQKEVRTVHANAKQRLLETQRDMRETAELADRIVFEGAGVGILGGAIADAIADAKGQIKLAEIQLEAAEDAIEIAKYYSDTYTPPPAVNWEGSTYSAIMEHDVA